MRSQKQKNDEILMKIEGGKKQLKNMKEEHTTNWQQHYEKREVAHRNVSIKLESLKKLIREQERRER